MVARRPHQAEGHFAGAGRLQGLEGAARGTPGVRGNVGISRRVGVMVRGLVEALQVLRGVGAEERSVGDGERFAPRQREGRLGLEGLQGGEDAPGVFGMARRGVFGATYVRYNFHARRARRNTAWPARAPRGTAGGEWIP